MRLKKNNKKNFFFVISSLTLLFFLLMNIFKVESVEVQAENMDCTDNLRIKNSLKLLGQNIFFINHSNTESELKKKFICIDKINLSKVLPNKISLQAKARVPKAYVYQASPSAEASAEAFLADEEGVIFSKDNTAVSAPKIFFQSFDINIGRQIDNFSSILMILNEIKKFGLDASVSQLSDRYLIIFSRPKIIFAPFARIDIQIASLQLILTKAKMYSQDMEFIDLRFDKPAVKFAPEK